MNKYRILIIPFVSIFTPDLSTLRLDRLCVMALWVCRACSPAILSPGLTVPEVNIDVQGIIGIPYMLTCRPVNLSPRVDRSRGENRRSMHYGYSLLIHLSTCPPGLTGPEVNMGVQGIMGIHTC